MFVILQSHFFVEVTKFKLKFLLARFIKLRYRSHSQLIERNLYYLSSRNYYTKFESLIYCANIHSDKNSLYIYLEPVDPEIQTRKV